MSRPATIAGISESVRSGKMTARKITETTLDVLKQQDSSIHSVTRLLTNEALAQADAVDALRSAGKPLPPLAGVPFGVKDLFDVAGYVTTAGSIVLNDTPPATHDALVVKRLKDAGAILVATLNMDEFAYGFATENSHYGTTFNPRDTSRMAGGSSGGSASSVAAGLLPLAFSPDTASYTQLNLTAHPSMQSPVVAVRYIKKT